MPAGVGGARSGAALALELGDAGDQVELICELDPGQRYSLAVETAVYFTCLEAVNNARKHALGASIRVRLQEGTVGLLFTVVDDGPGLGSADRPDRSG